MSAGEASGSLPRVPLVALVTGATSGIGEATARRLARAGFTVVVAGRREDRLATLAASITDAGGVAVPVRADLAQDMGRERLLTLIRENFGRLDLLVNAAGIMLSGPTLNTPSVDWDRMIDINLTGLVQLTKSALPLLTETARKSERGVVDLVNISSLSGRYATAENAAYAATKFGVVGFTEAIRREFSPHNVRVSVIEPGLTRTEIFEHQRAEGRDFFDRLTAGIELLLPDDLAEIIEFVVTRPRRVGLNEVVIRSIEQV